MSNSDSSQKNSVVPSWHAELKNTAPTEGDSQPQSPSRANLIDQAKKFLEEEEVRNASTDQKISFLESKGLNNEEIQNLIGITRHPDASAPAPSTDSPSSLQPRPTYPVPPSSSSSSSSSSPPPPQSTPPVITYPEFLTTPQQPTPLVTLSRLRTTLYIFGTLSALLYGTNNYLVTPMLASLTESRHSLASTVSSNLSKLISKLEAVVSEIPSQIAHEDALKHTNTYHDDEESDEDPTEMFHRDFGVQTSPPVSPRPGSASNANPIDKQETSLKSLSNRISNLLNISMSEGKEVSNLSTTANGLTDYLEDLVYVQPHRYGREGFGEMMKDTEDDEIGKVKAGIRSVKGVLLSTRSFPGVARTVK